MKIAVLAWGSLIWDKRELAIIGDWQAGGPVLPIEFSRVSGNGRLTLVIDPQNGANVPTLFARSGFENLDDAILNLRDREDTSNDRIGYVNVASNTERDYSRRQHPKSCDIIKSWARANDWQAVIWTALPSNFTEKILNPYTVGAAVAYVHKLPKDKRAKAFEYIHKAPREIDTPFRRAFQEFDNRKPMKIKELEPQKLGHKEDWLGNNAALECPVCGKVYIVSGFIKHERRCPGCGISRALITGAASKGGKAIITWDYTSAFANGQLYSRKEISAALGGSEIEFLPTVNKLVVCGCFTLDHNPEAPAIVIPGTGRIIQREANQFCNQDYPIPIFIKRRVNEWEYVGDYKAVRHSTDAAEITAHHRGSITPLDKVTRVIFLKRATTIENRKL